jgi:hypothetical protein
MAAGRKMVGVGVVAIGLSLALSAGVYIVPKEYDNTYNSIKSKAVGLIYNGLSTLSSTTKNFAGKNVRYRCMVIDKIQCRAATPTVSASVSDVSLIEPEHDQLLPVYGYEVFVEDGGNKWRICGAAAGGFTWDTSEMTSQTNSDGSKTVNYKYVPNTHNKNYLFFTDQSNKGSDKSFMTIDIQQKCI